MFPKSMMRNNVSATTVPSLHRILVLFNYLKTTNNSTQCYIVSDLKSTSPPLTWSIDGVVEYFKKSDISKYAKLFIDSTYVIPITLIEQM